MFHLNILYYLTEHFAFHDFCIFWAEILFVKKIIEKYTPVFLVFSKVFCNFKNIDWSDIVILLRIVYNT